MKLGLFPLPDPDTLAAIWGDLISALKRHRYASAAALPFPGRVTNLLSEPGVLRRYTLGTPNAYEHTPFAPLYYRNFGRRNQDAYPLFRMFSLGEPLPEATLVQLLGRELFARLCDLGMLVPGDPVRSRLLATPIGHQILFHDVHSIEEDEKPEFVFLGRCSVRLARHVTGALFGRVDRALDLCTGSGIQALHVGARAGQVVGGDINRRALAYAAANARANGLTNATFVQSDLFKSIDGTFDVITANTPFLLLKEGSKALDGYGGRLGMEVELRLFQDLDARLRPGGRSWVVASSAIVGGRNLLVDKLTEMWRDTRLTVELFPISEYYSVPHHEVYESLGVTRCVLYVVQAEKRGDPFSLREHRWPLLVGAANRAKVTYDRWNAIRRARTRRGAEA